MVISASGAPASCGISIARLYSAGAHLVAEDVIISASDGGRMKTLRPRNSRASSGGSATTMPSSAQGSALHPFRPRSGVVPPLEMPARLGRQEGGRVLIQPIPFGDRHANRLWEGGV